MVKRIGKNQAGPRQAKLEADKHRQLTRHLDRAGKLLAQDPFDKAALYQAAAALLQLGDVQQAEQCIGRLVKLEGQTLRVFELLVAYYFLSRAFRDSAMMAANAIAQGTKKGEVYFYLAQSLMQLKDRVIGPTGQPLDPLSLLLQAKALSPYLTPQCMELLPFTILETEEHSPSLSHEILISLLRGEVCWPADLFAASEHLMRNDSRMLEIIRAAEQAVMNKEYYISLDFDAVTVVLAQKSWLEILCSTVNMSMVGEVILVSLRRYLLSVMGDEKFSEVDFSYILYVLACQNSLNEFIQFVSDDEASILIEVHKRAIKRKACTAQEFFILAAYMPQEELSRLPQTKSSLVRDFLSFYSRIEKKSVRDRKIKQSGTGGIVQEFYEETPYPRWYYLPRKLLERTRGDLMDIYRSMYPAAKLPTRSFAERQLDVLVAGCGTGLALSRVLRIANAQVAANDISRTSVAYAQSRLSDLGFKSIDFQIMNILDLPAAGRFYDVIECGGVVHHMDDPWAGIRSLYSVLNSGGILYLGVYSKHYRNLLKPVQQAAKVLFDKIDGDLNDKVRKARFGLFLNRDEVPYLAMMMGDLRDFYSLSEFRDLLLHPVEHSMTVKELVAGCSEIGLKYLGIDPTSSEMKKSFDQHSSFASIEEEVEFWAAEEVARPNIFRSMVSMVFEKR